MGGADESNTDKTRNSSLPSNLATPTKIIVMEGEVKNENKEDDAMNENNESNTNNVNNYSLQLKSYSSTKRIEKQNQDKELNKIGNNNIINTLNSNDRSLRSKVDKSVTAIGKGNESGKGNKEDDNISGGIFINSNHRSLRSRSCSLTRSIEKVKKVKLTKERRTVSIGVISQSVTDLYSQKQHLQKRKIHHKSEERTGPFALV